MCRNKIAMRSQAGTDGVAVSVTLPPLTENDLALNWLPSKSGITESAAVPSSQCSSPVDSTRSWLVCAGCSLFICSASTGFRLSGLLLVSIEKEFNVSAQTASWPTSIVNFVLFTGGVFVAPLTQKFPIRPLLIGSAVLSGLGFVLGSFAPNVTILTVGLGVVHGLGSGALFNLTSVLLAQHFDRYRGMAFGIAHAASPMAGFIFPTVMNVVMVRAGFRTALLAVGLILIALVPVAFFLHEVPPPPAKTPAHSHDACVQEKTEAAQGKLSQAKPNGAFAWSIFKEVMFYVIVVPSMTLFWSVDSFILTIVDYTTQQGLSVERGVLLLTCFSVSDLVGRTCLPPLADYGLLGRDALLAIAYMMSALLPLLLCVCSSAIPSIAFIFLFGPFTGLAGTYFYSIVPFYLGTGRQSFAQGMMGLFNGLAFLVMPVVIGWVRDTLNDYRYLYITNGFLLLSSAILWFIVVIVRKRCKEKRHSLAALEQVTSKTNNTDNLYIYYSYFSDTQVVHK